jgi:hypothetical protein
VTSRWALALAASAALAAACGSGGRRPLSTAPAPGASPATSPPAVVEPPEDPVPAAVEASVTLYEAIAALPAARSCRETAAAVARLVEARLASIATVREASRGERRAEIDALFGAASARLGAASAAIDDLIARCSDEPSLATAIGRISSAEASP